MAQKTEIETTKFIWKYTKNGGIVGTIVGIIFGLMLAFLLMINSEPGVLNALLIPIFVFLWIGALVGTIVGLLSLDEEPRRIKY